MKGASCVESMQLVASNDNCTDDEKVHRTTRTCARIRIENVRHRDYVRDGVRFPGRVHEGHHVDIIPRQSIRLYGRDWTGNSLEKTPYDITFRIGDKAEYNSYNLHYIGVIEGIGEKRVRIRDDSGRIHQLEIADFSWRNRDFDLAKLEKANSEWLD
jgi:hypothetical protein